MISLLIKLFAFLKLSKVALSAGTMLLSVAVYTWLFGWRFAVGLPTFIPFVGAWVQLKQIPHSVETNAYIAMAGPVAGGLAATACYFAARNTGDGLLLALAYTGFLINLINMAPAGMLDGGQITAAVSPRLWLIGSPLMVALFFVMPNPMFLLIALFSWPYFSLAIRGVPADAEYFQVPLKTRINYGVFYLGLLGFLAAMTYLLHQDLQKLYPR